MNFTVSLNSNKLMIFHIEYEVKFRMNSAHQYQQYLLRVTKRFKLIASCFQMVLRWNLSFILHKILANHLKTMFP